MNDTPNHRFFRWSGVQDNVIGLVLVAMLLWQIYRFNTEYTAVVLRDLWRTTVCAALGILVERWLTQSREISRLSRELAAKDAELALRHRWEHC